MSSTPYDRAEDEAEQIDAQQRFGNVILIFTIIATLVILSILVVGVLSFAGVWSDDLIDPPV